MSTWRTSRPRSAATARHGETLASWSRVVTTISSPGVSAAATERLIWKVSVDMLAPNFTSSAEAAPTKSAAARWAAAMRATVASLVANAPPSLALLVR